MDVHDLGEWWDLRGTISMRRLGRQPGTHSSCRIVVLCRPTVQQTIPILTIVPQHHTTVGTLSKGVSSVVPILEGSWGRSIRTVSHPATKVRHGCRLSCCDGHGLRISTINLVADDPRWKKSFPSPSLRVCASLRFPSTSFQAHVYKRSTVSASLWRRYGTTAARVFLIR